MKTIIAGSRGITDIYVFEEAISHCSFLRQVSEVVCGGAKGVDTCGKFWGEENNLPIKYFYPRWSIGGKYIPNAGYLRNLQMAEYADAIIAVWDGRSPGTRHMIEIAERMNFKVYVFNDLLDTWYEK